MNTKMNDTNNVQKQYKDGKNLSTRVSLYEKYSVNRKKYSTWIFENYKFFDGCRILEFGSGFGKDWKDKVEILSPKSTLILSDFSPGMVEELRSRFGEYSNVETKILDIQDAQINDSYSDIVIANSMLYHVPDINKALMEVSRVLKTNGIFYATTSGNKSVFEYLSRTLPIIEPDILLPSSISFTLQNGREYLEQVFSHVRITKYKNTLEIEDTNDLLDFIYSVSSIEGLNESHRMKLYDYYESKKNSKGFISIDIEYGMFIAKK